MGASGCGFAVGGALPMAAAWSALKSVADPFPPGLKHVQCTSANLGNAIGKHHQYTCTCLYEPIGAHDGKWRGPCRGLAASS